jgi:hypothetical protein
VTALRWPAARPASESREVLLAPEQRHGSVLGDDHALARHLEHAAGSHAEPLGDLAGSEKVGHGAWCSIEQKAHMEWSLGDGFACTTSR